MSILKIIFYYYEVSISKDKIIFYCYETFILKDKTIFYDYKMSIMKANFYYYGTSILEGGSYLLLLQKTYPRSFFYCY